MKRLLVDETEKKKKKKYLRMNKLTKPVNSIWQKVSEDETPSLVYSVNIKLSSKITATNSAEVTSPNKTA